MQAMHEPTSMQRIYGSLHLLHDMLMACQVCLPLLQVLSNLGRRMLPAIDAVDERNIALVRFASHYGPELMQGHDWMCLDQSVALSQSVRVRSRVTRP